MSNTTLMSDLSIGPYASNASDYSVAGINYGDPDPVRVAQQDLAFKVPLGSQLNLLNAMTAGNAYLNYNAKTFAMPSSEKLNQEMLLASNALTSPGSEGQYFKLGNAYGR